MKYLINIFRKLFLRARKGLLEFPECQQELTEALETAYSEYRSGSMRSNSQAANLLKPWVGGREDSLRVATFVVDALMRDVMADPADHTYRQRCRYCARMVVAVPCKVQAVYEHPSYVAALYSLQCRHPYLFKEILIKLLRGPYGRELTNKAELFTQLAVGFDLLHQPKRAEVLLQHVQEIIQIGFVRPITADLALRLLAATYALQKKVVSVILLNAKAEPYAEEVYGLSPLQVDIAWTLAVCGMAMIALSSAPSLMDVFVSAIEHVKERRSASDDLMDVDLLMHGLDRSGYPHLSALSSMLSLRIMREEPPIDLDDKSLAITFVNAGNAALRNVGLAPEWNLLARHHFQELIKLVDSGSIKANPEVQYQISLAYAGIGYTYSNLARVAGKDESAGLYASAKENLEHSIGLLQKCSCDSWIEAPVWAVSGRIEAVYGRIKAVHQRFAVALLAGATYYKIDVEDLIFFFNPDHDVRLKYSEVLLEVGDVNTAILFAKAAVCSIHHNAAPLAEIADFAPVYIGARTLAHRTLINELGVVGRFNEGELAYDLLKENEYNEFTRRSTSDIEIPQYVALTPFELEAIRQSGLGDAVLEVKHLDKRNATANKLAEVLAGLNETLQGLIDSRRFSDVQASTRSSIDPAKSLGETDAILRFVASESALSISLSTYQGKKQFVVPIDLIELRSLIFEFRQNCRLSSSDTLSLLAYGRQLHRILFGPIEDNVNNKITHLYIETDHLLASIPFAALHDGDSYLIQRFSLIYFNRNARNVDASIIAHSSNHAAIFACTNLPGEELPGAALEAKVISERLSLRSDLVLEKYIDQECRVENFLREIIRSRGEGGLVHLATHASFDPSSDEASCLAFWGAELSIRTLRNELEKSYCDTGLFVLSACGTARQDIDVEGFSSVLLRSGVKTVVSTLWSTFDNSAPVFFHSFYDKIYDLSSVSAIASAARIAQLALLTPSQDSGSLFVHPAHWAPYIVASSRVS